MQRTMDFLCRNKILYAIQEFYVISYKIGNTSVHKKHFDTHQSLVEVTKKSFKSLIEFVVYIHLVNL
jgi:hypothetical protein